MLFAPRANCQPTESLQKISCQSPFPPWNRPTHHAPFPQNAPPLVCRAFYEDNRQFLVLPFSPNFSAFVSKLPSTQPVLRVSRVFSTFQADFRRITTRGVSTYQLKLFSVSWLSFVQPPFLSRTVARTQQPAPCVSSVHVTLPQRTLIRADCSRAAAVSPSCVCVYAFR